MPLDLVALGTVDGVDVRAAPVSGVAWDRGRLVRLVDGGVAWSLAAAEPPLRAASGRRLYLGQGGRLTCLDVRTGAIVWEADTPASITAMVAHDRGVDVVAGGVVEPRDVYGRIGEPLALGRSASGLCRVGPVLYAATTDGVWRLSPGARATLLCGGSPLGLFERGGALQGLVVSAGSTMLVEDDGLPLLWPFPEAATNLIAPWGAEEWAVCPRAGAGGVWVVDRRLRAHWQVPLPGIARALAVVGRTVAIALDNGEPALALTHPDVSTPLLLAVDGVDALHADGDVVYLTHGGRTTMYLLRET